MKNDSKLKRLLRSKELHLFISIFVLLSSTFPFIFIPNMENNRLLTLFFLIPWLLVIPIHFVIEYIDSKEEESKN